MNLKFFILFPGLVLGLLSCSGGAENNKPDIITDSVPTTQNVISTNSIDSVEIWDSLANRPFLFQNWAVSLDSILMFLPSHAVVEKKTEPSKYYDSAKDSIANIKIGESEIQYIKSPALGYIEYAIIRDKDIAFDREIRIGDAYADVIKKLVEINHKGKTFNKIYIYDGDATNTLIFEFKNGKLVKATFWPYTG